MRALPHLDRFGTFGKTVLLTLLCIIGGKIGLLLTAPPSYATLIWPPAGIAMGMIIVYGMRLWPAVFIGSALLTGHASGAVTLESVDAAKVLAALLIGAGCTGQVFLGRFLVEKTLGLPLVLSNGRQVLLLIALCGPVACTVAASVGIGSIHLVFNLRFGSAASNWLTWWMGDVIGIMVFLLPTLILAGGSNRLTWRGASLGRVPTVGVVAILIPLSLTLIGWKVASDGAYRESHNRFEALVDESAKALQERIESYDDALSESQGFLMGVDKVSSQSWQNFVSALDIRRQFSGLSGVGWITPVASEDLPAFIAEKRADGLPNFDVRRISPGRPNYILSFIEPMRDNRAALGLNISYEDNRLEAALQARDSGKPTLTRRITLLQDDRSTPGFLLLHPVYETSRPTGSPEERAKALRGWVSAPFVAARVLTGLTPSQGQTLNLRVYDGEAEDIDHLVYDSANTSNIAETTYASRRVIDVMQRKWLVTWTATPTFEMQEATERPLIILLSGLAATLIIASMILMGVGRRSRPLGSSMSEPSFIPAISLFIVIVSVTLLLQHTLKEKELSYVTKFVEADAVAIESALTAQMADNIAALRRMAHRWELAGGTPPDQWRSDAEDYTQQIPGLRTMEWIDPDFRVRWVEPEAGNEKVKNLDVRFDRDRETALMGAAERRSPTMTPPMHLVQGYDALIAYVPLHVNDQFSGFLAGLFSIDEFFAAPLAKRGHENYGLSFSYNGNTYFSSNVEQAEAPNRWTLDKAVRLHDRDWMLHLTPSQALVESLISSVPNIVLAAGIIVAALSSIALQYGLALQSKSNNLNATNLFNDAILSSVTYLIIATDADGWVTAFNRAAENAFGCKAADVIGRPIPALWQDEETISDDGHAAGPLAFPIVFDEIRQRLKISGAESREGCLIRADGSRFPASLKVTMLDGECGTAGGYLAVIEDITARKIQQHALETSEETFRSAMESASIGMALVLPDGRWLKVNKALRVMLGYDESELLGSNFQSLTHPDDVDKNVEQLADLLRGTATSCEVEKRYFHKDGHVIWALLNVSLVRGPDGAPQYMVTQVQDVTGRREMERIKSEFIAVVSHELRTPLTSIRGSLGLIVGAFSNELSDKVRRLVDLSQSNCERLILLINDILDIDKIASGQMRFDLQPVDLSSLLTQAVETNRAYGDKFSVPFVLKRVPGDISITVDQSRFMQVMANLLSNAAKFSDPGESVEISASRRGVAIRISVRDRGPGIPDEFRQEIFGKFSQSNSHATRNKGGSGLGLHISRQLVEQMGGTIGFETEVGKGTSFWMDFPITAALLMAEPEAQVARTA